MGITIYDVLRYKLVATLLVNTLLVSITFFINKVFTFSIVKKVK